MAGLEDLGLMEHTVILFMSDNGPAVNNGLLSDEGRSLRKINGFKGWKGNLWENGLRSPLFVKWGSAFQSGVQDQVVSVIDVLPTLMDLGGILPPDSISLDGQSFRTLLESQHNGDWENRHIDFVQPGWQPTDAPWTPEGVLNEYAPLGKQKEKIDRSQQPIAVIEKTYKLIRNPGPVDGYENTVPKRVLFDLSSDATEQKNLVDTFPGLAMELDEVANQWFESIKASPFSFQSPEFIIKKDTLSILPLFAPIQTTGDVKVAFRYLHQLKEGSSAAYFIHVEEAGNYNFRFETPNLKGAYQIQTEQGKSALLRDSTVASLTLVKGLQKLEVEVVEAGDSKLRELNILPVSLK